MLPTVHIWDIKFNPAKLNEIAGEVEKMLAEGRRGIHLTGVNAETVALAQRSDALKESINDSDFVNVDGLLTVLGLRFNGVKVPERVATPDLFESFMEAANRKGESVYFLGAQREILDKTLEKVNAKYPQMVIAGAHDGYYQDEEPIIEEIRTLAPTYLFIALPSPRKETFIKKYKSNLNVGVFYGVGGAFDVLGGKISRGPQWARHIGGLEAIFRLAQMPNLPKRVLKTYPKFVLMTLFKRKKTIS